jgi:regulator of protease activity HflC (stomatin/prohibitin superfamily)
MSNRYGNPSSRGIPRALKLILWGIGLLVLIIFVISLNPFFSVKESERAVVTRFGAFSHIAGPGIHFRIPFVNSIREFSVAQQQLEVQDAETFTVDNQMVKVDFVVLFEIPDGNVERIFREVPNYHNRLRNLSLEQMKRILGQRNIADLPSQRGDITNSVTSSLRTEAERLLGLSVIAFQLVNVEYSPSFRQAVEMSAVAKARVEQVEQERRQAEVQAQTAQIQARAQAEQQVARAEGEARSRIAIANAEAQAIRLRGEAEAASIQAQSRALADNPNYVQLRQAERWNGVLPSQLLGHAPVPFLNLNERVIPMSVPNVEATPLAFPAPEATPDTQVILAPPAARPNSR